MSNHWIEHNGGPQPVADGVWVEVLYPGAAGASFWRAGSRMSIVWKGNKFKYNILNQHLIDAARLEGIRLGLEAAATTVCRLEIEAARELEESGDCHCPAEGRFAGLAEATDLIRDLNPDTIARDVQTISHQAKCDNLHIAREAQHDS